MVRCGNKWCSGVKLVYEQYNKQIVAPNGQKSEVNYYCCPGWTQYSRRGHGCNAPICAPPCQNGGTCVQPGVCSCASGYGGAYCESWTRVFSPSCAVPCQHGGTCGTSGHCQCASGYQGSHCQHDVNECAHKPCDQICRNTMESKCCHCCGCCCCGSRNKSCGTSTSRSSSPRRKSCSKSTSPHRGSTSRSTSPCRGGSTSQGFPKCISELRDIGVGCKCPNRSSKSSATTLDKESERNMITICCCDISDDDHGDYQGNKELEAAASEAMDERVHKLECKMEEIEQLLKEKAQDEVTKGDINILHENMAIIAKNVKAMKNQLCKMDEFNGDMEDIRSKMSEMDERNKKLIAESAAKPKVPQSIVKICTNHAGL